MERSEVRQELYTCLKYRLTNHTALREAVDQVARPFPSLTEYYAFHHAGLKREVARIYQHHVGKMDRAGRSCCC